MDTAVNARAWLDHHDLLDPAPMRLETGIQRREDGTLLVAVRTDLHGCKGRMLDWVVDDIEAALVRAVAAGATLEQSVRERRGGRIAVLADPFGHGFCLIQFSGEGYNALVE